MRFRPRLEQLEARALLSATPWSQGLDVGEGEADFGEGEGTPRPDFHLTDVNSASSRYNQTISPRDYLQQVSAWYFGHAT